MNANCAGKEHVEKFVYFRCSRPSNGILTRHKTRRYKNRLLLSVVLGNRACPKRTSTLVHGIQLHWRYNNTGTISRYQYRLQCACDAIFMMMHDAVTRWVARLGSTTQASIKTHLPQ